MLVSRDGAPKDGLVTDFVDGAPLSKVYSEEQLYELGRELRKLHGIIQPGFGNITNGVAQFNSAREYLEFWFEKTLPFIENNQSAYIHFRNLHDSASGRIYDSKPSFIHRDMRLENIFPNNNGVKIIDFELWQGGDPMDELAISLYDWIITDRNINSYNVLLSGYHQDKPMDDKEITSLNFHLLMRSFRFISFCERINPKFKAEAYQNLDKVLAYLNNT
jgi:Ser/Thr protein kinase RdoA (MazF antagonist)